MNLPAILSLALLAAAPLENALVYIAVTESGHELRAVLESGETRALGACAADASPSWSPGGRLLAFGAPVPAGSEIRVYAAERGETRAVASAFAYNGAPRWDKEGRRLATAVSSAADAPARIAVHDVENGGVEIWGGALSGVHNPAWMPGLELFRRLSPDDGFTWEGVDTRALLDEAFDTGVIICTAYAPRGGRMSTEIMIATRTQAAPLLALLGGESARFAEWSVEPNRDGKVVAFESNDGGDREIFVLNRRGVIDCSNHRAADWNPVWSPDGEWLAFESFRLGPRGIYKLFPETQRVSEVYAGPGFQCWSPAWSPEGAHIAFLSDRSGSSEVYLLEADSREPVQLTADGTEKLALIWQPELDQ